MLGEDNITKGRRVFGVDTFRFNLEIALLRRRRTDVGEVIAVKRKSDATAEREIAPPRM